MLGFTVPLFVLLGMEALLALLLLGPRSLAAPALLICKATRGSVRPCCTPTARSHCPVYIQRVVLSPELTTGVC